MSDYLRLLQGEQETQKDNEATTLSADGDMGNPEIAVTLSMFGTLLCSISFVWMKRAHNQSKPGQNPCTNKWWLLGFSSLLSGSALHVIALAFGNQVLLSTLRSFTVFFNTVFSVWILKEKLYISDIIGITLIFVGSTLFLVVAKAGEEEQYSAEELQDIYLRPIALVYTSMSVLIIVGSLLTDRLIKNKIQAFYSSAINIDNEQTQPQLKNIIQAMQIYQSDNEQFKQLQGQLKIPMVLEAFCAGLMSAVYCSYLRGVLLQFSVASWWEMVSTYIYIIIVIPGAIYQLKLLNYAMALYDQAQIGPIYLSSIIMMHMLSGAIILDESAMYTDFELILIFSFSILCVLGIYIIAKKPKFPCFTDRPINFSRKAAYEADDKQEEQFEEEKEPDQIRQSQIPQNSDRHDSEQAAKAAIDNKYVTHLNDFVEDDRDNILAVIHVFEKQGL